MSNFVNALDEPCPSVAFSLLLSKWRDVHMQEDGGRGQIDTYPPPPFGNTHTPPHRRGGRGE